MAPPPRTCPLQGVGRGFRGVNTSFESLHALATLVESRLEPAPRAKATAATLHQIADLPGMEALPLSISDLQVGLAYLWACYTDHPEARAEGPIRSRMATVREMGQSIAPLHSSAELGAIARFRAVWQAAASFPGSGVDDARAAAIRATLARECAFLED